MNIYNNKKHNKILLSSIKKIYNKAKINGELKIKDLYYLNMISKLLNTITLEPSEIKQLEIFYNNLSYYSDIICKPDIIKEYYTPKTTFVQATKEHCDNVPLPDYTIQSCIFLQSIQSADNNTTSLNLKVEYVTCENVSVTTNYVLQTTVLEEIFINQCIKENTLTINDNLVTNLNDTLFFSPGEWEVRFTYTECEPT